jgi:hypothetical protein
MIIMGEAATNVVNVNKLLGTMKLTKLTEERFIAEHVINLNNDVMNYRY